MKNLLSKSVLFLSVMALSISCSKDDASASVEASLIGNWQITQETDQLTGNLVPYEHATGCSKDYLQISAIEITDFDYENDTTNPCQSYSDTFSYTRSGNTLIVTDGIDTFSATIVLLTGTDLRLKTGNYVTVFKKI